MAVCEGSGGGRGSGRAGSQERRRSAEGGRRGGWAEKETPRPGAMHAATPSCPRPLGGACRACLGVEGGGCLVLMSKKGIPLGLGIEAR